MKEGEKVAGEDLFVLFIVDALMIIKLFQWDEISAGMATIIIIFLPIMLFFTVARIYHLTHREEVFGDKKPPKTDVE